MEKICSYCGKTIICKSEDAAGICNECNQSLEEAFDMARNLRLEIESILNEKYGQTEQII